MKYHTRFGLNALFAVCGRWERTDAVRRAVICHFGESCAPIRPSIRESSTGGGRAGGAVGGRRRRWRWMAGAARPRSIPAPAAPAGYDRLYFFARPPRVL